MSTPNILHFGDPLDILQRHVRDKSVDLVLNGAMTKPTLMRRTIAVHGLAVAALAAVLAASGPLFGQWNERPDIPEPQVDKPVEYIYRPPARPRGANIVGVMFVPAAYGQGDDAEASLYELALQIPGVDYLFTGRTKDQLFAQVKRLKDQGKTIDLLIIGGHIRADDDIGWITMPNLMGIKIAIGKSDVEGLLTADDADLPKLQEEIRTVTARPNWKNGPVNRSQVNDACKRLQLYKEMGEAMAPGAEVLVLSCLAGHAKGLDLMQNLGAVFLGKSGGSITGPTTVVTPGTVGVQDLPEDAWFRWIRTEFRNVKGRLVQLREGLAAGKWLSPGEAFASAGGWQKYSIPAGCGATIPAICSAASSGKAFSLTATTNEPRDDAYYRISPAEFVLKADAPGAPQAAFTLEGQAPQAADPGDAFVLKVNGTVQDAKFRYGVVLRWYEDGSYMRTVTPAEPDRLWIGMDYAANRVVPSGSVDFKVIVPQSDGQELQLRVEYGVDYNAENRWMNWVAYTYARKP